MPRVKDLPDNFKISFLAERSLRYRFCIIFRLAKLFAWPTAFDTDPYLTPYPSSMNLIKVFSHSIKWRQHLSINIAALPGRSSI
jgi:hypothetical protein